MRNELQLLEWRERSRPKWYHGRHVGDEYGPVAEAFFVPVEKDWPIFVVSLRKVLPDGGVDVSISVKTSKTACFSSCDNAGFGLPSDVVRGLAELMTKYAGPKP